MAGQRIQQARHHRQVHHGGLVHHQQVQVQRVAPWWRNWLRPGITPSSRCRVPASVGMASHATRGADPGPAGQNRYTFSVRRAAACRGATSRIAGALPNCRPVSTRMASSLATVVVLPVPGPPEMTAKGRAAAVAAASFWPLQQSASGHQGIQPLQLVRRLGAPQQRLHGGPIHLVRNTDPGTSRRSGGWRNPARGGLSAAPRTPGRNRGQRGATGAGAISGHSALSLNARRWRATPAQSRGSG